jgi:hypothetical protein
VAREARSCEQCPDLDAIGARVSVHCHLVKITTDQPYDSKNA